MQAESPSSKERALAQQMQEKFELYLVSLVFTLLALAVQSSVFGSSHIKSALELVGWLLLLVSGLSGLYRLQYVAIVREKYAAELSLKAEISELKRLKLRGTSSLHVLENNEEQPIELRLANFQHALNLLAPVIASLERRLSAAHSGLVYFFVAGLVCVMASRGYEPMVAIIKYLSQLHGAA